MTGVQRLTAPTADVLRVLTSAGSSVWGLQVIKATGRAAGTVYPILERLEHAGLVRSRWEDDPSRPGPRRRYYELTDEGRAEAQRLLSAFADRGRRRSRPSAALP